MTRFLHEKWERETHQHVDSIKMKSTLITYLIFLILDIENQTAVLCSVLVTCVIEEIIEPFLYFQSQSLDLITREQDVISFLCSEEIT